MTFSSPYPSSSASRSGIIAPPTLANDATELVASGGQLVVTLNGDGRFFSFSYVPGAEADPELLALSNRVADAQDLFVPMKPEDFLERVRQSIRLLAPQSFSYPFRCGDRLLFCSINLSPILLPGRLSSQVILTGSPIKTFSPEEAEAWIHNLPAVAPTQLAPYSSRYEKLLTQIAWNTRRSLDLDMILNQTVRGLGDALRLRRCLIGAYDPGQVAVRIVAEYNPMAHPSALNAEMPLAEHPSLERAIATLQPIQFPSDSTDCHTRPQLAIATCYQDKPNGLLILDTSDQSPDLSIREIELIGDLADQVGTGVAHAKIYAELQALNENLICQKNALQEERRKAEEASRLKTEFLANTSHELRTPLNGMIGFLKLVLDGMADTPEEHDEFVGEAYNSAVHLLNIINDILDLAKIEAGKMQITCNPVKLDDLLNSLESFTRQQAEQKHLLYEIRIPATHDPVILFGNYQRLLQVMINLVGNAIKFTHEGSVTISAEVIPKNLVEHSAEKTTVGEEEASDRNAGMVKISVADTGIGVSLEKQDLLFQSFSQVDGSHTRQYGGTGLGLAISQRLVEKMGGVVNFFSLGEGLGSTVTFTVPLYQEPVLLTDQAEEDENLGLSANFDNSDL
ncbi:ATP-binding protein [Vacuolonema iberomarrocanum]|uniref:ATP-binding protein n=1 Tax=Vacuolonema iberomarrocanum TaxID=3454632 RepID=UPI0019FC2DB9|nr:GAF domain-containing protein [filamentous cyanobacterium LEGE 07170]